MQIDLGQNYDVSGLMIQGRADNPNHWVSKISIQYFEQISDKVDHDPYEISGGSIGPATWVKERGLKSMFTIPNNKSNKICFDDARVFARYIRIFVHEWNGWPAMRAGALLRDDDY